MSRITSRPAVIIAVLAGVALVVLAGGRPWVGQAVTGIPGLARVTTTGSQAAPAGTALALVAAAGAVALALTDRIARRVVAALLALAGLAVVAQVAAVLQDPAAALAPALETATGRTVAAGSVDHAELTGWPWLAVGGGAVITAGTLVALALSGRWGRPGRRFGAPPEAGRAADRAADRAAVSGSGGPAPGGRGGSAAAGAARRERVVEDWDALSRGEDPTQG